MQIILKLIFRALAEEQERKAAQAKKEEAAKQAELQRQEKLAAQAAAERAAEQARQVSVFSSNQQSY